MPPDKTALRGAAPAVAALLALAALLAGCESGYFTRDSARTETTPVVDRATTSGALLVGYLNMLQRLAEGAPAEQAEILASAQREYEITPTPSHQLRYALVLATPGHPATDQPRAQRLLREVLAVPEMLLPVERTLATLELLQIDDKLTLESENRRLRSDAERNDRERTTALNRRLQAEVDENAKLRKELEEARAKLDAIANIERALSERKPSPEGRSP